MTTISEDESEALYLPDLKVVLARFCTGVTVVTGLYRGEPVGFTCHSFSSLSLDPPYVCVCPSRSSTTWPRIRESGRFCVNILAADQQTLCRKFAISGSDKFAGMDCRP